MIEGNMNLFWPLCVMALMLFTIGFYCIMMTYNLIRALIGVELLIKAATLLIIAAGFVSARVALAQALVITLIVIEVVFIVVAIGVVVGVHRHTHSLDVRQIRNLKG